MEACIVTLSYLLTSKSIAVTTHHKDGKSYFCQPVRHATDWYNIMELSSGKVVKQVHAIQLASSSAAVLLLPSSCLSALSGCTYKNKAAAAAVLP